MISDPEDLEIVNRIIEGCIEDGIIRDDEDNVRVKKRMELTSKIIKEAQCTVVELALKGASRMAKMFSANYENLECRYIKVFAKSIMNCPDWHLSPGGRAWIFIDEIVVE